MREITQATRLTNLLTPKFSVGLSSLCSQVNYNIKRNKYLGVAITLHE